MIFFQKLKKKDHRLSDRLFSDKSASNTSINSVGSIDSLNFDDSLAETSLKKSLSNSEINSLSEQEFLDSGLHETRSLNEVDNLTIRISPEKVINLPSLTDAQVRAITGLILKFLTLSVTPPWFELKKCFVFWKSYFIQLIIIKLKRLLMQLGFTFPKPS